MIEYFNGMEVQTNDLMTETTFVLHKPERFVEYDEKDWPWLAYFGFGVYKTVPSTKMIVVDGRAYSHLFGPQKTVCYFHPETWKRVKEETQRQKDKVEETLFSIPPPTGAKYFL